MPFRRKFRRFCHLFWFQYAAVFLFQPMGLRERLAFRNSRHVVDRQTRLIFAKRRRSQHRVVGLFLRGPCAMVAVNGTSHRGGNVRLPARHSVRNPYLFHRHVRRHVRCPFVELLTFKDFPNGDRRVVRARVNDRPPFTVRRLLSLLWHVLATRTRFHRLINEGNSHAFKEGQPLAIRNVIGVGRPSFTVNARQCTAPRVRRGRVRLFVVFPSKDNVFAQCHLAIRNVRSKGTLCLQCSHRTNNQLRLICRFKVNGMNKAVTFPNCFVNGRHTRVANILRPNIRRVIFRLFIGNVRPTKHELRRATANGSNVGVRQGVHLNGRSRCGILAMHVLFISIIGLQRIVHDVVNPYHPRQLFVSRGNCFNEDETQVGRGCFRDFGGLSVYR